MRLYIPGQQVSALEELPRSAQHHPALLDLDAGEDGPILGHQEEALHNLHRFARDREGGDHQGCIRPADAPPACLTLEALPTPGRCVCLSVCVCVCQQRQDHGQGAVHSGEVKAHDGAEGPEPQTSVSAWHCSRAWALLPDECLLGSPSLSFSADPPTTINPTKEPIQGEEGAQEVPGLQLSRCPGSAHAWGAVAVAVAGFQRGPQPSFLPPLGWHLQKVKALGSYLINSFFLARKALGKASRCTYSTCLSAGMKN